jgi:hypothetical protein
VIATSVGQVAPERRCRLSSSPSAKCRIIFFFAEIAVRNFCASFATMSGMCVLAGGNPGSPVFSTLRTSPRKRVTLTLLLANVTP